MFQKMKNNFKKIVSLILSLSMVISSFGASTNNFVRASAGQDSASARFVKYTKDHPVITQLGIVGVCAAAMGLVFGGIKLSHMYTLKDVTTAADGWDDTELGLALESEIGKFNKNGEIEGKGSIFEVDESARKLISKKVLYLFLRRINIIIDEYPYIIERYKLYLNNNEKQFIITAEECHKAGNGVGVACTDCGEGKFVIYAHRFKDLDSFYLDFIKNMNSGYHPPCDPDKFIESLAAHEMGHIIQGALATNTGNASLDELTFKNQDLNSDAPGWKLFKPEALCGSKMRKCIVEKSRSKGYVGDGRVSEYGQTNALEWFAECFACLYCCSDEGIKKLTDGMRDFLHEKNEELRNKFQTMGKTS